MNFRHFFGTAMMLATAASLVASPATAVTDDELLISLDGTTYAAETDRPVFVHPPALVPQGSETRSVWLRNDSEVDGELRVVVDDIELSSPELAQNFEITSREARTGDETTATADELTPCSVVVPTLELASGESVRIDLSVGLRDVPAEVAQQETVRFSLTASIRDTAAGAPWPERCERGRDFPVLGSDPPDQDEDHLAYTGTDVPFTALVIGAALVLTGASTMVLVRKRRRRDSSCT
ncbi:hypothetical protein [Ruania alba]|uniref:LPXTG-motif cell wall anchor domain-containing protein n=1 Tax=Ruania alba TaxID=648782 RepID=A0A1H5N7Z1_9MICO|nr:hypothetical protein [Ruania alba]SEE96788.1 hypothetical protein SAMN04488554_3959 [Ruania alba]